MPAPLRRVVTGVDTEGRSTIKQDAPVTVFYDLETLGGLEASAIWEVQTPLTEVTAGGDPPAPLTLQPLSGAIRFFRFTMPPESAANHDLQAIMAEIAERVPSLLQAMDPKRGFGMHQTDTIDLGYVVSGAVDLVLEDGSRTTLRAGDSYVQLGTWHAWHNPYDEPCVLVLAMVRRAE